MLGVCSLGLFIYVSICLGIFDGIHYNYELVNNAMLIDNKNNPKPQLLANYVKTRQASLTLCEALETEDFGLQAMPEVSPPKWHLAHTSWFFETFILKPFVPGYREFHPQFEYLFNSYYNAVGAQYPRSQRGLLSRPSVKQVYDYRQHVDTAMGLLLNGGDHSQPDEIQSRCELGIHHEQQHQELFCTDIKYSMSFNPLYPALSNGEIPSDLSEPPQLVFLEFGAAMTKIGHQDSGFHFDNETPAHLFHQEGFRFANRLVTNAEYLQFIQDNGYNTAELWLADGWVWRTASNARQPLHWVQKDGQWFEYTLYGLQPLRENLPVCHVSYYEADAYARWRDKRLPSEQEWEFACNSYELSAAHQVPSLHPRAADEEEKLLQMFGHLWQWTCSSYSAYPGYRPAEGAIGEYNGKFMCNQMVLRGSSCVTPTGHARPTYRNFFYPKDQWQFSGIRLADDL